MTDNTLDDARAHAAKAWSLFNQERRLDAHLTWDPAGTETTQDGSALVSARVEGRAAGYALHLFTSSYMLILGAPGDQRPKYDFTDPDRVACVWRSRDVWVELWVPADAPSAPEPVAPAQAVPAQSPHESVATALRGLGGRLPFTRNRRAKETTTA